MTTATEPLTVELPVCPVETCKRVGKLPGEHFRGKEYCVGTLGNTHRKVRMEKWTFEAVA